MITEIREVGVIEFMSDYRQNSDKCVHLDNGTYVLFPNKRALTYFAEGESVVLISKIQMAKQPISPGQNSYDIISTHVERYDYHIAF